MSSALGTPARRPRVPAFVVAMVIFGIAVVIGNLLVMRFVAPTMLRNVAITHLKPTLVQIVLLVYASTFVAALIAGAASAYRGFRRGSVSRGGNFVSAVFGTCNAIECRLKPFRRTTARRNAKAPPPSAAASSALVPSSSPG